MAKYVKNITMATFSELFMCNFVDNPVEIGSNELLSELWSCKWLTITNSELVTNLYKNRFQDLSNFAENELLATGIGFLLAFVQENFTGPDLDQDHKKFLTDNWPKEINACKELIVDSEDLIINVKLPEYLFVARYLFKEFSKKNSNLLVCQWWNLRLLCVHQHVLEGTANKLYENFKKTVDSLLGVHCENTKEEVILFVEICHGYLLFLRTHKADEIFQQLCEKLQINLNVEGILGVRTKFQQTPLPQLCLKVEQKSEDVLLPSAVICNGKTKLPKLLKLDDEVRLEKIKFVSEEDNDILNISSIVQTIVLAKIKILLKSQPQNKLGDEEIQPYITTLLHQDFGPLAVRLVTLLLNIKQEACHKRTVERSLKQCEEILKHINENQFSVFQRFSYAFASSLMPRWLVQKQLGDLMLSLGLIKSALDLYIKIQSWEDVILCYTQLELRHKAAEIIRQEIDKNPTVKLYCLLGDAIDDVSCYEVAWKMSKETSSRAQRHWGNYYFARREYSDAIPHLQKSLEINSLQEVTWLRLGYSAIVMENWELAVQSYLRYTHLEPNGFESWNNLAKALIKLGDKKRAHKILKEALKCNFNNWKVWENFMMVSAATKHFDDVLNAYNRLIELKENFLDLEILTIVTNLIAQNTLDAFGNPSEGLRKKANTLLGHQCVQHLNEPKLWKLSALLAETPLLQAQKLQKAYTIYTQQNKSWSSSKEISIEMIQLCICICEESCEAYVNSKDNITPQEISQLSSARLSSQGCIKSIEKNLENFIEIENLLFKLKGHIEKINEILKIGR